jgi:hypothetical protein
MRFVDILPDVQKGINYRYVTVYKVVVGTPLERPSRRWEYTKSKKNKAIPVTGLGGL